MEKNIWKYAVTNGMRFNYKGSSSIEDIAQIKNLKVLDSIYKTIKAELRDKSNEEEGLSGVASPSKEVEMLEVAAELVKEIYMDRKAEGEQHKLDLENKEKKQLIAELINKKKNQALENLSIDELTAMLGNM